jgi:hypothetical protein
MKLYRAKIPQIAKEVVEALIAAEDVEVLPANRGEAEKDLVAIMEEYRRRDFDLRNRVRDTMHDRKIPHGEYGRTRKRVAEEMEHPVGDDVERFLTRQFIENLMISPYIEEVYAEDAAMYKRVMEILRGHNVDENAIREEAADKVKNVASGTVDYEVALNKAVQEVKKRRGLI